LADRWEQDPYTVLSQPNNGIPVYQLRKENDEGRTRILHRNLLLQIGYIGVTPTPAQIKLLKRKIRNKIKELEHTHTDNHITDIHRTTIQSMGTLSSVKRNQWTVNQPSLKNY